MSNIHPQNGGAIVAALKGIEPPQGLNTFVALVANTEPGVPDDVVVHVTAYMGQRATTIIINSNASVPWAIDYVTRMLEVL